MLKLKFQYFGHLMQRTNSFKKTLMLGMRWLYSITDSMEMNLSKFRETVEDREDRRAVVHGVTKSWTRLRDRTATTTIETSVIYSFLDPYHNYICKDFTFF